MRENLTDYVRSINLGYIVTVQFFCKITRVYQIKYFMKRKTEFKIHVLTAFLIHTQLSLLFLTIQNY